MQRLFCWVILFYKLTLKVYIICNMRLLDFDFYVDSRMEPLGAMNTQIKMKTILQEDNEGLNSVFIIDLAMRIRG